MLSSLNALFPISAPEFFDPSYHYASCCIIEARISLNREHGKRFWPLIWMPRKGYFA